MTCVKFLLLRPSNKILVLDLPPFSEKVEKHCFSLPYEQIKKRHLIEYVCYKSIKKTKTVNSFHSNSLISIGATIVCEAKIEN